MAYGRTTRELLIVFLSLMNALKVSAIPSSSPGGITVDFVNDQSGATAITVSEDSNFVSLLVTAFEDVSVRVYPEESRSSAMLGEDYMLVDETYNLSNTETVLVFLNITDDNIVEALEFIDIAIESNVSTLMHYFVFIPNNDRLSIAFEQDAYTTSESSPANVCATIIEGSIQRLQPVSLALTISPGSASSFEDYVPINPVLSFTSGGPSTVCANIPTVPDNADAPRVEDVEDYFVASQPNSEVEMLAPSNMTVYITDEDGAAVSIFNPLSASPTFQVNESDSDVTIRVYVRLSPPENVTVTLQRSVDVYLSTSFSTADDSDFVSVSNELITIPIGSTMASFNITICGDIIPEGDEQFTFNISTVNPADQVVPPSQGTITILNDDEVPDCRTPPDPGVNGQVNFTVTTYLAETNYSCDLGYDLIGGAATRTCLLNGTWSGEDPSCQMVDCGNLTSPLQGSVLITETTFGSDANYSCCEGYELDGNVTRTCLESGIWSGSEPTCNLVDCGDLSPPPYGNVTFNSTHYQSLAVYYCSFGYSLVGNSTRYCPADGQWSGEDPTCEIVDCGSLVAPLFGEVNLTDTVFGSVANYSCQRGYRINGTNIRLCEGDGQWSESMPQCIPVDCGNLSAPSNGQVNISNGTLYPSGEAIYRCNSGYELIGQANRYCLSDGWSGEEPTCELLRCGDLPDPLNGQVSTNNPPADGTFANYTCDNGFQLMGTPFRLCQRRQWSGSPPECVAIDCGNLTDPLNGTVSLSSTTFQSVADYNCASGFVLDGTMSRSCQSNGIWSEIEPLCQAVDCGELGNPVDGAVTFTAGTTFESIAEYSCNLGFLLIGSLRRTCQVDGQWSGSAPLCTPDTTLTGANSNSEFVVTVVSASVGGFALAVVIIVIIIIAAIARILRKRRESYNLAAVSVTQRPHNQRLSQLVSPLHPGVFIPMSGLDHPLYDSVFANTGSSSELQDESTTVESIRPISISHPAIILEDDVLGSNEDMVHITHATSSHEAAYDNSTHDDQRAQQDMTSNVIYDNRSAAGYQDLECTPSENVYDNNLSAANNDTLPDNASFVFYDNRPTD